MEINFIQINLHKAYAAAAELQLRVADESNVVCLVQEPCVYKGKFQNRIHYSSCFPSAFVTKNPRAAIFASKKVKFLELPQLEDRDTAVCLAKIRGAQVVVASVYLDQNYSEVITDKLREVIRYAENRQLPLIIGMDSNCHSSMFGPTSNSRGDKLDAFIIESGLNVENIGQIPTFQSSRYSSCIDVTLSRGLFSGLRDWRVDCSYNASDHNTILFKLSSSMIEIPCGRNWNKGDWERFKSELESVKIFRPAIMTDCKLDKMVGKLYHVINRELDSCCPMLRTKKHDTINEWFTEDVAVMRDKVGRLYERAKNTRAGSDDWSKYKKAQKQYRAKLRSSKRKHWNLFKIGCDDVVQTSRLVKILQRRENNSISTFSRRDGTITLPGEETARHLLDAHFPSNLSKKPVKYKHYRVPSYEVEGRFDSWINCDLTREALLKFKDKKSPGPDGLKPLIFQYLPPNIIETITFIYKASIALSFTPTLWRESKVIFIPKPGKIDYTIASSFRPISSNYLLKGLERLCVWRADVSLLEFPIHERQHGFRCDRSTETAISELTDEIESNIFNRRRTLVAFLDIKSAFDSIKPELIKRSLINHRVPELLVEWYFDYITNRRLSVELQDAHIEASVDVGFPQGGVASAKFWLIAFNMAVKLINTSECKGTAFADDCAVAISGSHPKKMIRSLQKVLDSLETWGRRSGLIFNPNKTVVVMFERRKEKTYRCLKMGGLEIPYSDSAKYLGVTLDKKLTWKKHIADKIAKVKRLSYIVNQAVRGNWGPSPLLSRWAMTGIIRPVLTYAASCWAHAVTGRKTLKELEKVDRLGLLSICQCAPSTPTKGLRVIYGVPPLKYLIDKLACDTFVKYRGRMALEWRGTTRTKTRRPSHLKYLNDRVGSWGIELDNLDDIRVIAPDRKYRVVVDSLKDLKKFRTLSQYNAFTDGSKTEKGVGAGALITKGMKFVKEVATKLPDYCTVFQAELLAIFEAARCLISMSKDMPIKFIKIFTDSAASLFALRKRIITSNLVLYCVKALNRLAGEEIMVSVCWIRSHSGHFGNEQADELAKEATGLDDKIAHWIRRPLVQVRARSEKMLSDCWGREWSAYKEARMTKQFFHTLSPGLSRSIMELSRGDLTTIVTMVTSHNDLRYHSSLRDPNVRPECRLCGLDRETFFHLFVECPRLNTTRFKILGYHFRGYLGEWQPGQLLDFCDMLPFHVRENKNHSTRSYSSASSINQSENENDT